MTTLTGFKDLLEGPPGAGKTYSIGTLVETGLEVFYLTLGNELESLVGYFSDKGKPIPPNLHWHKLAPSVSSIDRLMKNANLINTLSTKALHETSDPEKGKHDLYYRTLGILNDFEDQRTGQSFGPVDSWDTSRVLVIDPLTLVNDAVMSMVIGGKAFKNQQDYGLAQDQLEKMIRLLTQGVSCHVVVVAHVERETDQVFGGVKVTTSLIGRAMADRFPSYFSDVILSQRIGKEWVWSTASVGVDTKARNLPWGEKLQPSFQQVYDTWKKRNASLSEGIPNV